MEQEWLWVCNIHHFTGRPRYNQLSISKTVPRPIKTDNIQTFLFRARSLSEGRHRHDAQACFVDRCSCRGNKCTTVEYFSDTSILLALRVLGYLRIPE
jgi:hypothetical protein